MITADQIARLWHDMFADDLNYDSSMEAIAGWSEKEGIEAQAIIAKLVHLFQEWPALGRQEIPDVLLWPVAMTCGIRLGVLAAREEMQHEVEAQ